VGNEIQIPLIGKGIKIRKGGKLEWSPWTGLELEIL
jgi:hypothetical protein